MYFTALMIKVHSLTTSAFGRSILFMAITNGTVKNENKKD